MGKNWFFKTIAFNLSVFVTVAAFLLYLLFNFLMQQNEAEIKHVSGQYAAQVMQTVDSTLQSIDQAMLKELATSSELHDFMANAPWTNIT